MGIRAPQKETASLVCISYHDTVNVLQGAIAKDALCPFARTGWFRLLEDAGARPIVALARDGEQLAAMILAARGGSFESLVNWYSFSWAPAVCDRPDLLTALAADLRSKTHRVTLAPVKGENDDLRRLQSAFSSAGWAVKTEQCDHNHVLEVKGRSYSEYLATRNGQLRATLNRKTKKVEVEILTRFDSEIWADYETIYQRSWKPTEGDPELLRNFARQEGSAGRIRLALARHHGKAVAAQFWTVDNGIAYIHKLAHLEEYSALSAGTTLSAALFKHAIDTDRVTTIDYGTGNDPYKSHWMEVVRPRYRIDCLDPKQPRAWPSLAKRQLVRLAPSAARS